MPPRLPETLRREAPRVAALSALAFVTMATYGLVRPAAESLFLEAHELDEAVPPGGAV